MPITASEIKAYFSGGSGNTNPNASLGGAISTTEMTSALFDNVTGAESSAGSTEYRCIYVKNTNGSLTWQTSKIWIQANSTTPGTAIAIGLGTSAVNGTEQTVGNETTAPSGVSFSAAANEGASLAMGNIPAGQHKAIWIRRTINAGTSAASGDGFTLRTKGDTDA